MLAAVYGHLTSYLQYLSTCTYRHLDGHAYQYGACSAQTVLALHVRAHLISY
jgi:hypothetical protein